MRTRLLVISAATLTIAAGGLTVAATASTAAHYRVERGFKLNNLHVTPGEVFHVSKTTICRSGYATSVRNVSASTKTKAYAEYGITSHRTGQYEVDHLISLELGGDNSLKNLWPEPNDHPRGYLNTKDKLENKLHALVCSGQVPLTTAQHAIATDWVKAYAKYEGTAVTPVSGPPKPTPTATMTATPTAGVAITSIIDPVSPGSTETATATSKAGDSCDLEIMLPSGRQSTASGLGGKTTDGSGAASWTWTIGSTTDAGTATASLSCGAGSASRTFTIS